MAVVTVSARPLIGDREFDYLLVVDLSYHIHQFVTEDQVVVHVFETGRLKGLTTRKFDRFLGFVPLLLSLRFRR